MAEIEAGNDNNITRVLIGIDDSENCLHAFEYYTDHIHKPENEVILFHVSDQVKLSAYAYMSEGVAFTGDEIRRSVEKLKQENKKLEAKYDENCKALEMKHRFLLVSEDVHGPGHAIVEAAKKHNASLIVVGSRGIGALKRAIMGSVSTYVIHHGHIPALVVHPKASS